MPNTGGLYKATTDQQQIRARWARWPNALIGIRTGAASGIFAIDPDVPKRPADPNGIAAWNELVQHNCLPATRTHVTPTGGVHVLFRWHADHPVTNKSGALPAGIDVRGEGGYIIAPPSMLSDGRQYAVASEALDIAEAPEWLYELLFPASGERERDWREGASGDAHRASSAEGLSESHKQYASAALERECAAVAQARPGTRNEVLNRAAFSLGTLVGAGALDEATVRNALLAAASACGLMHDDGEASVRATIDSGLSSGICNPRDPPKATHERGPFGRHSHSKRSHARLEADAGSDNADDSRPNLVITQDNVALIFAERHGRRLRYCHDTGAWFEWTGTHWRKDGTDLAFQFARELGREASADALSKEMKEVRKVTFAGGVERFARGDRTFAVKSSAWDANPFLLGTPGGTVDLRRGTLCPADPAQGITRQTAVAPADRAECPLWLQFLEETSGGDAGLVRFLQQWCGYSLTGDVREHALLFVYGAGGNGKSVFLNTTSKLLGTYAATAAMDTFTASQSDKHPADMAMLHGHRMVSASETEEGRAWAESRIKQMTGGDPVTARFMRQDFFTYSPQFKLMIVGNHKPVLRNVDDAARRRFNLVPFTRTPVSPDRELEGKLAAEWPAILRWMIEGCLDWRSNGLVRPQSVQDATAEYFSDQDLFGQWLDDECEVEIGNEYKSETVATLFASWSDYAHAAGESAGSKKAFSDKMRRAGCQSMRLPHARTFRGVRLRRKPSYYNDG
jgi:putative DNA primase/helicase